MIVFTKTLLITGLLTTGGLARDVPSNIKALYNSIRAQGSCSNVLKGGFYSQENDTKGTVANYSLYFFISSLIYFLRLLLLRRPPCFR